MYNRPCATFQVPLMAVEQVKNIIFVHRYKYKRLSTLYIYQWCYKSVRFSNREKRICQKTINTNLKKCSNLYDCSLYSLFYFFFTICSLYVSVSKRRCCIFVFKIYKKHRKLNQTGYFRSKQLFITIFSEKYR